MRKKLMFKGPDDIFGPDDDFPKGPIIDVTPKKQGSSGEVEYDSDVPIIEQILSKGDAGPDRTDQRPSLLDQINKTSLLIIIISAVALFLFLIWLVSKLF